MQSDLQDVSLLLRQMREGDREAESRLWDQLYPHLHSLAETVRQRERPDHTLSTTALLHEAYLRLISLRERTWLSRAHFIGVAAHVMRRVLVDHARSRGVGKRAGPHVHVELDEEAVSREQPGKDILALDGALAELERFDPKQSRIVELRFFGGLTDSEIAEVMGIGLRTVTREMSLAKAWLYAQLNCCES
jgi:RNA polymerase sigma-70 factor, ECF subfamily